MNSNNFRERDDHFWQIGEGEEIILPHGSLSLKLSFPRGNALGLIGPNGVGKSSVLQYFKLQGHHHFPQKILGHLDQYPLTPLGNLTGSDLLQMLQEDLPQRCLYTSVVDYPLIDQWSFAKKLQTPIRHLSGGENQILKLLALFYLQSDLYFLDEPTHYLDAEKSRKLLAVLQELLQKKKEILIVDHRKDFLWSLCAGFIPVMQKRDGKISLGQYRQKEEVSESLWNSWISMDFA